MTPSPAPAPESLLSVGGLELLLLGAGIAITLGLAVTFLLVFLRKDAARGGGPPGGEP